MEIETTNLVGRMTVASLCTDGKPSLKGVWLGHVNHLNFGRNQPYLWNG